MKIMNLWYSVSSLHYTTCFIVMQWQMYLMKVKVWFTCLRVKKIKKCFSWWRVSGRRDVLVQGLQHFRWKRPTRVETGVVIIEKHAKTFSLPRFVKGAACRLTPPCLAASTSHPRATHSTPSLRYSYFCISPRGSHIQHYPWGQTLFGILVMIVSLILALVKCFCCFCLLGLWQFHNITDDVLCV